MLPFLLPGCLTFPQENAIISHIHGELSERFKEPVLKTGDSERNLGFESLTLRQKKSHPYGWFFFCKEVGLHSKIRRWSKRISQICFLDVALAHRKSIRSWVSSMVSSRFRSAAYSGCRAQSEHFLNVRSSSVNKEVSMMTSRTIKKYPTPDEVGYFGGELGIRTLGSFRNHQFSRLAP